MELPNWRSHPQIRLTIAAAGALEELMEQEGLEQTQLVSLPPIAVKPKSAGKKKKSPEKSKHAEKPKSPEPKEKKSTKDASAAHPAMIGVDMHSMHPFHSELMDGLYKRPLVVSILIPKKRAKQFKYESSKKQVMMPSDLFSSGGEESDASQKRARTPERPSSRQSDGERKKKTLKIFIVKVYDLVESKEAIYSVVVRDFDKMLEELIDEEKSFAVCDYFKPQSLEWWAKSLRNILITFDRPNGELSVVVDKKLIRRMVTQQMQHHVWMDKALTAEQEQIQMKMMIDKSKKKSSKSTKVVRVDSDPGTSTELVPWNDYTAMGERNPSASSKGPGSSKSSRASPSIKTLPPVRSAKIAPPRLFVVGDWVEGNFKRAGQWFAGIVKKVHKDNEYYDIDYDDGRAETRVEAKLVRASASDKKRSGAEADSLDLVNYASASSADLPEDPSSYDYGDAFSPGATGEFEASFNESSFAASEGGYGEQSYGTDAQYGDGVTAGSGLDQSQSLYGSESVAEDGAVLEASEQYYGDQEYGGEQSYTADGVDDYEHQAYDYTNEAVIAEDSNAAPAPAPVAAETGEEVADSAELLALENCSAERKVATPYVEELIASVLSTNYPIPEDHFPAPAEGEQQDYNSYYASAEGEAAVEADASNWEYVQNETAHDGAEGTAAQSDEAPQEYLAPAADAEANADLNTSGNAEREFVADEVLAVFSESAVSAEEGSMFEESDYAPEEAGSPGFKSSPSKIALASMLQALSMEESSLEGSAAGDPASTKVSKSKKAKRSSASSKRGSSKNLGPNSSSILLDNSGSEAERSPPAAVRVKTAGKKFKSKVKPVEVPEGLFASPAQKRAKTASGLKPPNVDKYVAAAVIKTDPAGASTDASKPPRSSASKASGTRGGKVKAPASTSTALTVTDGSNPPRSSASKSGTRGGKVTAPSIVAAANAPTSSALTVTNTEHTITAPELLKDVPLDDDLDSVHSMHSMQSLQSLHSTSSHPVSVHFTADAHGNFDHTGMPHYPYAPVNRVEATKAALEAIHKPHSNPHDRYTYLMMPAPVSLTHVDHHRYGYGPKHEHAVDEHGNPVHGHGEHGHGHGHGEGHGHGHAHGEESVSHTSSADGHASSPHGSHEHHGHHHPHHGKELHIPRHEHDFIVDVSLEHASHTHKHEPSIFSETVHFGDTHHPVGSGSHSPGALSTTSTISLPTLPHIRGTSAQRRGVSPNPALLQMRSETDVSVSGTLATQGTLVTTETRRTAPGTAGRPGSKSKRGKNNPFEQKEKFHGPARRVVDIIEWARISVGGSPKKQTRKLSAVEKRLLKSPLALKLIVDAPVDVNALVEELNYKN